MGQIQKLMQSMNVEEKAPTQEVPVEAPIPKKQDTAFGSLFKNEATKLLEGPGIVQPQSYNTSASS